MPLQSCGGERVFTAFKSGLYCVNVPASQPTTSCLPLGLQQKQLRKKHNNQPTINYEPDIINYNEIKLTLLGAFLEQLKTVQPLAIQKSESQLFCLKRPATDHYPKPHEFDPISSRLISMIHSHSSLDLPIGLFHPGFLIEISHPSFAF